MLILTSIWFKIITVKGISKKSHGFAKFTLQNTTLQ